jgi:ABC-2 type transport system ATP-binding protein
MPAAIRTQALRKVYRRRWGGRSTVAVENLHLTVPEGAIFGFLGLNGAGKTTTVMMLLGCARPTAGSAHLFDRPAGHPAARRRVGFLPEKFRFHEFLTPNELLRVHGGLAGLSDRESALRTPPLLALVGLQGKETTPIREFSKGMQQRLGIAQALLSDPDLLILDEPTSALDPLGRREVRDVLLHLKAHGKTVFLNSHLLSEIELCCDRVAVLHRGRLVREGPIHDLLAPMTKVEVQARGVTPELRARVETLGAFEPVSGDGTWTLNVTDASNVPRVAAMLVAGGAELHALIPRRESLEDFFVRVVEGDPA